ncbi:MAG: amidohydrolase [Chloroflexi bacterium]|nr:amidohydrolase [Chloroflexota bacterium]MCC6895599.1 amidohydrolase [Anaerolineae bacterium]
MRLIDRVIYNANIITLDSRQPRASAIAIRDNRIFAVGSDDDMLLLASAETTRENAGGATIIPGLTDAHIHWEQTARGLQQVNLFEVPQKSIAVERVAARAATTPAGEWVTGYGWFQDIWDGAAFPSAADLDAITPNHPVFMTAKSFHAGWVNSYALRLAGITASTPDPDGGHIVKDADGNPTGLLLELSAMDLVRAYIPKFTPSQVADQMKYAQELALSYGLTGIHDFDEPSALVGIQILRERGELGLRTLKNINKDWLSAALDSGLRVGFGDDWIRIGALKMFADGALGPHTALMIDPYIGEPENYGIRTIEPEEMTELMSRASAAGLPSTVHAIGDRAIHDVLDAIEIVRGQEAKRGEAPSTRRHRIEHVQVIHPKDVHRLAELKVIASMQPLHATSDMLTSDKVWGDRSRLAYNPRVQLDQGVICAFGSDSPVEPFDPFTGIHAAVTRQRPDGSPGPDGWYPEARLTVEETLHGYTTGAAYAAGMEDRLGKLAPGFLADLVVINHDLYNILPAEILKTKVHGTMVDGVWRHGGL